MTDLVPLYAQLSPQNIKIPKKSRSLTLQVAEKCDQQHKIVPSRFNCRSTSTRLTSLTLNLLTHRCDHISSKTKTTFTQRQTLYCSHQLETLWIKLRLKFTVYIIKCQHRLKTPCSYLKNRYLANSFENSDTSLQQLTHRRRNWLADNQSRFSDTITIVLNTCLTAQDRTFCQFLGYPAGVLAQTNKNHFDNHKFQLYMAWDSFRSSGYCCAKNWKAFYFPSYTEADSPRRPLQLYREECAPPT